LDGIGVQRIARHKADLQVGLAAVACRSLRQATRWRAWRAWRVWCARCVHGLVRVAGHTTRRAPCTQRSRREAPARAHRVC
jgi:hypothetical protein